MATKEWKDANQDKMREYRRDWYYKNKEKQISRQLEKKRELAAWLREYKRTLSCQECGMSFDEYPGCCDFHHIDPSEKDGNIQKFLTYGKNRVLKEIEKCIPLCANCHRKKHADM